MPTLAESPALDKRIAQAVVSLLSAIAGLSGVAVRLAEDSDAVSTPYISVAAHKAGEAIANSGVHIIEIEIRLNTTVHAGDNSTDDETLLQYDAALEEFCIGGSMFALATAIENDADFVKVYNCQDPQSEATDFDEEKRNIAYTFQAHAIGLSA